MTCRQKHLLILGLLAWGLPANSIASQCSCGRAADSLEVTESRGAMEAQQVLDSLEALSGSGDPGDRSVCLWSVRSPDYVCIPVRPVAPELP